MNTTIDGDVGRYAAAVRASCGDLPGPARELLLEDLEDHLQEVAAEAGGPLEERLGRPEAYAAELRASAGLPAPGTTGGHRTAGRRPRETWVVHRLDRLWRAGLAHPAGRAVVDFLPELRPAWWVVRGYLAVQAASVALTVLFADGLSFPVPQLFGSRVLGLIATVAAVAGSVKLGRRSPTSRRARTLTVAGNAALGLFAVILLAELGSSEAADDRYHPEYVTTEAGPLAGLRADGREINNIFPFDADGKPLQGVYLVDQDGNPVVASHDDNPDLEPRLPLDRDGNQVGNHYPQQQYVLEGAPAGPERRPGPTPEFRPPPGELRPPPDPDPSGGP